MSRTRTRDQYELMAKIVPPGEVENVRIVHHEITEQAAEFARLRSAIQAFQGRIFEPVKPGVLTQLYVGHHMMMSDAEEEKRSNSGFLWNANGDVLIAGLGIGMVLVPVLKNPEVKSVLVIEKYKGVIDLVEPHIRKHVGEKIAKKLTVIHADIFEWKPAKGSKWDTIYFDIWPDINTDDLKEMTTLKRKFARSLRRDNPSAWMKAWQEDYLRYQKQRYERNSYEPGFRCGTFR